jgi:hypothetical protein
MGLGVRLNTDCTDSTGSEQTRALRSAEGLHPTLRDETAKDGAPGLFVVRWGETTGL